MVCVKDDKQQRQTDSLARSDSTDAAVDGFFVSERRIYVRCGRGVYLLYISSFGFYGTQMFGVLMKESECRFLWICCTAEHTISKREFWYYKMFVGE